MSLRFSLCLFSALLLAACSPLAPADPFAMIQTGQELQAAGNAALQATREAVILQAQVATLQAARTQDAATATQRAGEAQVTATAQAAQATQTSQAAQITATAQAQEVTQTARADQVKATTTALGLIAAQNEARRQEARKDIWNVVWILLMIAGAIGFVWGLWQGIPPLFAWLIEWADRRRSVYETRSGTVAWIEIDGVVKPVLLTDANYYRPRSPAVSDFEAVKQIGAGVMEGRPGKSGHTRLHWRAVELLQKADQTSDQVPGWRDVGWSSAEWQEIIGALRAAGAVVTQAGKGTFVAEAYDTVGGLRYALEVGTITIKPPAPEGDA